MRPGLSHHFPPLRSMSLLHRVSFTELFDDRRRISVTRLVLFLLPLSSKHGRHLYRHEHGFGDHLFSLVCLVYSLIVDGQVISWICKLSVDSRPRSNHWSLSFFPCLDSPVFNLQAGAPFILCLSSGSLIGHGRPRDGCEDV